MDQQYRVAAYCRLSRDDENIGESGSITSQKEIIRQFCEQNDLVVSAYYQDDGFTGTNFQRPDFQRLLEDIETGKINCVITKDLSRLGRDYIMTGYYIEQYFPEQKVRYIAITDNLDTIKSNSNTDIAPFKNLINDLYAKDISKKIRSSLYAKAMKGEHGATYAPMGYKKDPNVKNHLIIDEETAGIVKNIFELYCAGMGCYQLRNYLEEHKVLTPSALLHVRGERYYSKHNYDTDEQARYRWSTDMVLRILSDEVYIGSSIHYRNRKPTLKSKTKRQPKDSYLIIPNTHEPLIDMETWEKAKRRLKWHMDSTKKYNNIFLGVAKCADCGKSMSYTCKHYKGLQVQRDIHYLCCYSYTKFGRGKCTCHYTDYDNLSEIVLRRINEILRMVHLDEDKVLAKLRAEKDVHKVRESSGVRKKIEALEKRQAQIKKVFAKLYEDHALAAIPEENYRTISENLLSEQEQNQLELDQLKSTVEEKVQTEDNIQNFMELMKSVEHIDELDADVLNAFIDRIDIHNIVHDENGRSQQIDIYYKFVGRVNFFA